jgi:hypothetical protein
MISRTPAGSTASEAAYGPDGGKMQFYNLKTRSHVDIPEADVRKKKMIRKTKSGEQVRYALTANYEGTNLYKFVNEATFTSSNAKEVS